MVQYCVAYGCSNLSDKHNNIQFHRFPFSRPETLKLWVIAIKRDHWTPTKTSRLCSQHFLESDYEEHSGGNRKFLKSNAVPTIFNFPPHLLKSNVSRRPLKRHCNENESPEVNEIQCKITKIVPNVDLLEPRKYVDRASSPIRVLSPEKQRLKKKIKILNQKIRRRNKKITSMQDLIDQLHQKGHGSENLKMVLQNHFSGFPLDFLLQQKENSEASATHRTYTEPMKMFAQTLYFYSPKAYKFVRDNFYLPAPRTLRKWLSKTNCNPGFLQEIFEYLKKESQCKDDLKDCSLVFDSMAIRKQIAYDASEDRYLGYVDFGGIIDTGSECPASEVLMFQIVSYKGNFKCPVAYFLINKIDANVQAELIKACITKLFESGIVVHSLTCDGAPVNINTLNILGTHLSINGLVPYFKHPVPECNTQIHCMLDACHMLKLARNAIAEKCIVSENGLIQWTYLKKLNEIQEKEDLKLANSISFRHISYKHKIMNVRLASQTLSSSVANALEYLSKNNTDFTGAAATIEFIRIIDRIFDALNSRNPFGKGFKAPIRPKTLHVFEEIFDAAEKYLKSLKIDNIFLLQHPRKTFALGFIVTLRSTINLAKDLFTQENRSLSYFLTYKCSQDHLELYFSCIRSRGGWNNNPSCMQLKWALRQMLFKNNIKPSVNGNAIDVGFQSTPVFEFRSESRSITKTDSNLTNDDGHEHMVNLIDCNALSDFVQNVLYYVAGYVVRKIIPDISCEHCVQILYCARRESDHMYTRNAATFKQFTTLTSKGGLILASDIVFNIINATEKHFRVIRSSGLAKQKNIIQTLQYDIVSNFSTRLREFIPSHPLTNEFICEDLHEVQLVKKIVLVYAKLRLQTCGKKITEYLQGNSIRHKLTKIILFKNM